MIHIPLVVEVEQFSSKTVLMETVKTLPSQIVTSKTMLQAQMVVLLTGTLERITV